jgi:hypothetical protein
LADTLTRIAPDRTDRSENEFSKEQATTISLAVIADGDCRCASAS